MEHACCLGVIKSLRIMFTSTLCFSVIVKKGLFPFCTISYEKCVYFSTYKIWTNKCCMQPEKNLCGDFYFIAKAFDKSQVGTCSLTISLLFFYLVVLLLLS